jgi:hypothetical protein
MDDPREILKELLGEAGLAEFEEGIRKAAKAKGEKPAADVEGQSSCLASCRSYCGSSRFLATGSYSRFSF